MRNLRPCLVAALMLLLAAAALPLGAAEIRVRALLEPEVLGVGDEAFLSIEVQGGVFKRVGFEPEFELVNFEQVGNPAESNNVRWVNGVASRSQRLTWRLRAGELGLAAVRGIRVRVGGQVYELPARQARVVEDPPPSARRQPSGPSVRSLPWRMPDPLEELLERRRARPGRQEPEVRLIAEATPARPWQGQQVTYTLWLYLQSNVARINPKEVPEFRGFWVEEIPRPGNSQAEPTELDGERFYRTPILRRALFPLRPGRYEIDPAEVFLVLRSPATNPFGRTLSRTRQVERRSNRVVVDVRPLPPPSDLEARFDGLVGNLTLDARLVPSELAVGEAATLEVTLAGEGNAEGVGAPAPTLPEAVDLLPAAASGGNRLNGLQVRTERSWTFPLVPREPGTWRLPPVEIAYFDPTAGTYRLARSEPLVLRARRGEPGTPLAGGGPALHPIKNAALPDEAERAGGAAGLLPWLFALPWALVLVAGLVRMRHGGRREPSPLDHFHRRLDDALTADRPRQTAIAIEAAWHDLLAEVFELPSELPPSRWPEHLTGRGVALRQGDTLGELIDDLHYLRNAPQLSTIGQLTGELAERSRRLARRLTT